MNRTLVALVILPSYIRGTINHNKDPRSLLNSQDFIESKGSFFFFFVCFVAQQQASVADLPGDEQKRKESMLSILLVLLLMAEIRKTHQLR